MEILEKIKLFVPSLILRTEKPKAKRTIPIDDISQFFLYSANKYFNLIAAT